ncbi:MAG: hypothetical protein ACJ764_00280 [Solirubrobacteraceae bacterium]
MQLLQTPSSEHEEFDRLCEELQEFETLPSTRREIARTEPQDDQLNDQILECLVSPV